MNRKKILKKVGLGFMAAILLLPVLFINRGSSQTQPYYSGDAISYNGQVLVGTADTGYLEIYKLTSQGSDSPELVNVVKTKNYNMTYNSYDDYSDLKFSLEDGNLYVYAISQYSVYKYNFSDLRNLVLVLKQNNTYWEWYKRIDRFGDKLGLISDKGIKIINSDLQVINSYNYTPSDKYSVRQSDNLRIFGINEGQLQVYDRSARQVIKEIPLNFDGTNPNHKIYFNKETDNIFVVDDYYAKKFNLDGQLLASYRHLDAAGYDMESSAGNAYVYFSNGFGVVKMNQASFEVISSQHTTSIGGPQGWAMGLKLVNTNEGDRLFVFNGSNILVLDGNLKKIASVKAEEAAPVLAKESLFINLDHYIGMAGTSINVTGGGYLPNESIKITFGNQTFSATAGSNGRYSATVTVPSLSARRLDVKVDGVDSLATYSTAFEIIK